MDKKARADHAARLLEDEVLQAAFNGVKEYHTGTFLRVTATDDEVLEARRQIGVLEDIKRQLHNFVAEAKIEQRRDQDRGSD